MSTLKPVKLGKQFNSTINLCRDADTLDPQTSDNIQATPEIEKKYVHHVYDAIAPHFSAARCATWPKVAGFLNSLSPGSVVLDAGCGNGKYLEFNQHCFFVGSDISPPLVGICARRGHEVLVADAVNLPYRSDFGDAAISLAVLHHLSTESWRRKAIEELIRVVRKGGLVLITVLWAVEQEDRTLVTKWAPFSLKYNEGWVSLDSPRTPRSCSHRSLHIIPESGTIKPEYGASEFSASSNGNAETNQEYFVPRHLPCQRAETDGASAGALANGLARKDDKNGAVVCDRYYHVFVEGELERLVAGIENATVREKFYDKSNWGIILEKI